MAAESDAGNGVGDDTSPPAVPPAASKQPHPPHPEPYFSSDSDDDLDPTSPIDSLFAETRFTDHDGEPPVGATPPGFLPLVGASASRAAGASAPQGGVSRAALTKNQRLLFWIAGGVIAVLVLAVLFALGTRIGSARGPAGQASGSPTPTPSSPPTGPAAIGTHRWSDLRGGECVNPYTTAFAEQFTVVDCATAHPAQLVFRGTFPAPTSGSPGSSPSSTAFAYPGVDALQSQITLLCTAPGVIDLGTARAYTDLQLQAAYAATGDEWARGQHDYFCFVSRASGAPITGSVAGTPAK